MPIKLCFVVENKILKVYFFLMFLGEKKVEIIVSRVQKL
jgi:hypothetical protein